MDTTTVLFQVGAALWTLATRDRSGLHVVSVATGPSTWSSCLLFCDQLALLSEHSLLVVGLLFLVILTVPDCGLIVSAVLYQVGAALWTQLFVIVVVFTWPVSPRICCSVPSWRCSLNPSYSSSFWSSRGQCCYWSITVVLVSTVLCPVGAAVWTLAIRRLIGLYVISVTTGPPAWTQLSCIKLALLSGL